MGRKLFFSKIKRRWMENKYHFKKTENEKE
jgi:hypothetical protein